MSDKILLECEEHQLFMKWVNSQPKINKLIIHIENEGRRSGRRAAISKARGGLSKGVSDFFLALPNGRFSGLWIELKKTKGSKITKEQIEWAELMRSVGYSAEFALGWMHAKVIIESYLGFVPGNSDYIEERCVA